MAGQRTPDAAEIAVIAATVARHNGNVTAAARELDWSWHTINRHAGVMPVEVASPVDNSSESPNGSSLDKIAALIRKRPLTLVEIAESANVSKGAALDWVEAQQSRGLNICLLGDRYSLSRETQAGNAKGCNFEYVSRDDNTFYFGACGDNHLGSKYARLDVLNSLYDRYAAEGVDRVFNAGNWIDGEARFNKFDLTIHGMDAQLRHLAEVYPAREGIHTYAVAGDDHEGWYAQREGVNIGRMAAKAMRDQDRNDWHDLGYMEATIKLTNANTGASSSLMVIHPGGGSSYAVSYTSQKIVESLEGGEKPAVILAGHYHKMWAGNLRNIWFIQTGTTEDQTPFMRKKRLEAHVGGYLVKLRQDPKTGAITEMTPTMIRYFNRAYYENDRWSHSGSVTLPDRRV